MHDTSYDDVPYLALTHAETHPDRLATVATLLGCDPAPTERCRVLELGCASGANLLPMAEALPESTFVGVDVSRRQIADGEAAVAELGLRNVSLRAVDILEVGREFGDFDYIIAHGVFSWVPKPVQDHILAVARQNLAPRGVAYVSYNAYPGWHTVGVLRDMLLFHTRDVDDPEERAAMGHRLLELLMETPPDERTPFGEMLATYAESLRERLGGLDERGDTYLLHDALAAVNTPLYFAEFAERSAAAGLQYVAEADSPIPMPPHLVRQVATAFGSRAEDVIDREQYLDFLRGRMFRRTLLCHGEVALDRDVDPARMEKLHVASRALPVPADADADDDPSGGDGDGDGTRVARFRGPDGVTLAIDHPVTKAAMRRLAAAWPRAIAFGELADASLAEVAAGDPSAAGGEQRGQHRTLLAQGLLTAHCYTPQLVELRPRAPRVGAASDERPVAARSVRAAARRGTSITDAYHQSVPLDAVDRRLIQLLDGTRDRRALRRELPEIDEDELERRLRWIAHNALLSP